MHINRFNCILKNLCHHSLFYTFYLQACNKVTIDISKFFAVDNTSQNALLTIDYPEVKIEELT